MSGPLSPQMGMVPGTRKWAYEEPAAHSLGSPQSGQMYQHFTGSSSFPAWMKGNMNSAGIMSITNPGLSNKTTPTAIGSPKSGIPQGTLAYAYDPTSQ